MGVLDKIAQRQLDLGPAGWFRPEALTPNGNQIRLKAGVVFLGGTGIASQPDQLSVGFAVAPPGQQRYDLVYVDRAGAIGTQQGTAVALGSPPFQGGPGWTGTNPGPQLLDDIIPCAYVLVDEPASVVITQLDVTEVVGHLRCQRDLAGFYIDKGFYSANGIPLGTSSTNVSPAFTTETPNGGTALPGVVTTPPLNLVELTDQNDDDLLHTGAGDRIYGRLTWLGGVWTMTYFYLLAGVETPVGNITTDTTLGAGLTDIRMLQVGKVYSENDPTRPLFYAPNARQSDLVAGTIPDATTVTKGKVLIAVDQSVVGAPSVPAANDSRLGRAQIQVNGVDPTGGRFFRKIINLIPAGSIVISAVDNPGQDRVDVTVDPPPGVPLGGILPWSPLTTATAPAVPTLPPNFEYADGIAVSTIGSPYHPANLPGYLKPSLMKTPSSGANPQRFARGADYSVGTHGGATAFGTGGVDAIPGDTPGTDTQGGATPFNASGNTNSDNHSHSFNGGGNIGTNNDGGHNHTPSGGGNQFFAFISAAFNMNNDGAHSHGGNSNASGNTNGYNHSHGFGVGGNINTSHSHTVNSHTHGGENRPAFQHHAYIMRVI